jgi:hypothetical protein
MNNDEVQLRFQLTGPKLEKLLYFWIENMNKHVALCHFMNIVAKSVAV